MFIKYLKLLQQIELQDALLTCLVSLELSRLLLITVVYMFGSVY